MKRDHTQITAIRNRMGQNTMDSAAWQEKDYGKM